MSVRPHRLLPIAALALGLMLGGCFTQNYQRGYILADGALEQIPLGAPQEQVLITLGTPSTVATVSGEVFYYISARTEQTSFLPEKTTEEWLRILKEAQVRVCIYGHLHGKDLQYGFQGEAGGIRYHLVSVDAIDFRPVLIELP